MWRWRLATICFVECGRNRLGSPRNSRPPDSGTAPWLLWDTTSASFPSSALSDQFRAPVQSSEVFFISLYVLQPMYYPIDHRLFHLFLSLMYIFQYCSSLSFTSMFKYFRLIGSLRCKVRLGHRSPADCPAGPRRVGAQLSVGTLAVPKTLEKKME